MRRIQRRSCRRDDPGRPPGRQRPSRRTRIRTSPPGTYRIARNSTPPASPASNTGRICGSSTAAAIRDSRKNRARNSASAGQPRRQDLHRHHPAQPLIPRPEHHRHPALADLLLQHIPSHPRPGPNPGQPTPCIPRHLTAHDASPQPASPPGTRPPGRHERVTAPPGDPNARRQDPPSIRRDHARRKYHAAPGQGPSKHRNGEPYPAAPATAAIRRPTRHRHLPRTADPEFVLAAADDARARQPPAGSAEMPGAQNPHDLCTARDRRWCPGAQSAICASVRPLSTVAMTVLPSALNCRARHCH